MANIKEKIDNIRQAIFGKDVRESLASGLEEINKETEKTSKKQEDLETTFNDLIINAGNSNAEVVAARNGYATVGERLKSFDEQLDTINKKRINGNILFVGKNGEEYETITEAINVAISNNVSKTNRFSIYISNGTYIENLTLADGIDLYGQCNVVITFSASGYRNGDTIYSPYDCSLNNLTVIQDSTNDQSDLQNYPIHVDGRVGDFTLTLNNCVFKALGNFSHHALGAGLHGGQNIIVNNCEFHSDGKPAFYVHNWNNLETTGMSVVINNSIIYGCKLVDKTNNNYGCLFEDTGSNQIDEIKINNTEITTFQTGGFDICLKKHTAFTGARNSIIVKLTGCDYRNFTDEIDSGKIITDKDIIAIKSGDIGYGKCCSLQGEMNGIITVNQTAFNDSEHCLGVWVPYSGVYGVVRTTGVCPVYVDATSSPIEKFSLLSSSTSGALKKGVVGSGVCFAIALENFSAGQGYIKALLINKI